MGASFHLSYTVRKGNLCIFKNKGTFLAAMQFIAHSHCTRSVTWHKFHIVGLSVYWPRDDTWRCGKKINSICSGPQVPTSRKPTTQQFLVAVLWVFWTLALLRHRSLRCAVGTSTTQQFHFVVLPKNPQHNNLKLLCCRFSGRWHLWATVSILADIILFSVHST